jgi:hypothetical protein
MTACITAVLIAVALVAAARSTWSPCGLSMLSTITPVSERAKGHSYRLTSTWFVLGATVGGACLGAVMAILAMATRSFGLSPATLGLLAMIATLVAAVSDSGVVGRRVPYHRRQVNERWLDQYRAWVYGAGFGWQIGCGVATYITSAAVYLMVLLGATTASPLTALLVGTGFGLLRGLAVLLTRRVKSPARLRAFHRRFAAAGPKVGLAVVAIELAGALALVVTAHSWAAVALVAVAGLLTVAGAVYAKERGLIAAPTCPVPPGSTSGQQAGVSREPSPVPSSTV